METGGLFARKEIFAERRDERGLAGSASSAILAIPQGVKAQLDDCG